MGDALTAFHLSGMYCHFRSSYRLECGLWVCALGTLRNDEPDDKKEHDIAYEVVRPLLPVAVPDAARATAWQRTRISQLHLLV